MTLHPRRELISQCLPPLPGCVKTLVQLVGDSGSSNPSEETPRTHDKEAANRPCGAGGATSVVLSGQHSRPRCRERLRRRAAGYFQKASDHGRSRCRGEPSGFSLQFSFCALEPENLSIRTCEWPATHQGPGRAHLSTHTARCILTTYPPLREERSYKQPQYGAHDRTPGCNQVK